VKLKAYGKENSYPCAESLVVVDTPQAQGYSLEQVKNKVILGDALKVLKKLPSEAVDMVFIDPPYFLQLPNKTLRRWKVKSLVEAVQDDWDKFSSFVEYDTFMTQILSEARRVMKPNATI